MAENDHGWKAEQVDAYARLSAEVKAAIQEEFFTATAQDM
jgi:hypothetical protein